MIQTAILTSCTAFTAAAAAEGTNQSRAVSRKAKVGRKKKSKQRVEEHVYYVVEILGWEWSFMFGVSNSPKISGGPYDDHRHLRIRGRLIRPSRLKHLSLELTFLPDERLNWEHWQNDRPPLIGHLSFHGQPMHWYRYRQMPSLLFCPC